MKKGFLIFCALFLFNSALAKIIRVPENVPKIQQAINQALAGDTVLIADGLYQENINFNGKAILVASNYLIDKDYSHIRWTVINGENSEEFDQDTASVVCFVNDEDSSSVLYGLTIRGGSGTRVLIRDWGWWGTEYRNRGGGIYCNKSSPKLEYLNIIDNSAEQGAGICCSDSSSPIIKNTTIKENLFISYGGGMYCQNGSNPRLYSVKITDNKPSKFVLHNDNNMEMAQIQF